MTPEQHTNDLIAAVDYELNHFGPASLADSCASIINGRCDDDRADAAYWTAVREAFEKLSETLITIERNARRLGHAPQETA